MDKASVFRPDDLDQDHHIHACNSGWVSMEVELDEGDTEEVLYLCRRCQEAE